MRMPSAPDYLSGSEADKVRDRKKDLTDEIFQRNKKVLEICVVCC